MSHIKDACESHKSLLTVQHIVRFNQQDHNPHDMKSPISERTIKRNVTTNRDKFGPYTKIIKE